MLSTNVSSRAKCTTYVRLWLGVGCEVTPEVNISAQKYIIKVFVPTQDSLSEVWIRADSVSTLYYDLVLKLRRTRGSNHGLVVKIVGIVTLGS